MNQAEIKVTIDVNNASHVSGLNQFLNILGGNKNPIGEIPQKEVPKKETPKKVAPKKVAPKKEVVEKEEETTGPGPGETSKKETPEKEAPEKETPKKKVPKKETGITLESLRGLLSKKVKENRKEIKDKLNEFKAPNLTTLSEDKYEEMEEFLNSL